MEDYYVFLRIGKKGEIDEWLNKLDEAYYNGNAKLSDENYDNLIRLYEERFGKREVIGSKPTHNTVNLPIAMMSLDKFMTEKELQRFLSKNSGPFIVMDKVNGNAALYEYGRQIFNRGDGTEGTDLSHILSSLSLPKVEKRIKGELVINKRDYEPFKEEYTTNLSMINGLLNSRSPDPEKLKLFDFIAYDVSENSRMSETLMELERLKFKIPFYIKLDTLSIEKLSEIYKKRKEEAPYDVDGLVIAADRLVTENEKCVRENPKHMMAFKEYGATANAIVERVEWDVSKHSVLKPVIKIQPLILNSSTIKSLTGFNAGWIVENKVGPGSELIITHNIIPHILSVEHSTEASYPPEDLYPPESWKWNESGVDIILIEENDDSKIAKIYDFFKQLDAKYIGESLIKKLYEAGFDSVKKILEANKEDFLDKKIKGLGEKLIDRMLNSIEEALRKLTLAKVMSASCLFGTGFGSKMLLLITETYPDVLERELNVSDITSIKGFADKRAEQFIQYLPRFKKFLEENPILLSNLKNGNEKNGNVKNMNEKDVNLGEKKIIKLKILPSNSSSNNSLNETSINTTSFVPAPSSASKELIGKSVVFTGFRDSALEDQIRSLGGKVTTSVSKSTGMVVVGGVKGTGSSKESKATEYGIPIYTLKEFKKKYL